MKTRGKNKKVLIIVLTLIVVFCFSVFSVLFINLIQSKNIKEDIQPRAYTFNDTNGRIEKTSDERYKDNTYFYISSPKGLIEFAVSVAYGCSFAGKFIYLTNNLDMTGWNYCPIGLSMNGTKRYAAKPFSGTFLGCGFTVSNITTTIESEGGLSAGYFGFFAYAEVANIIELKIKNFTITNYESGSDQHIGGLIGHVFNGGSKISNCCVEDLHIINNNAEGSLGMSPTYAGGFVGTLGNGSIEITNCMLNRFTITENVAAKYKQTWKPGYTFTGARCTATKCIINTAQSVSGDDGDGSSTATYVHTTANTIEGLSVSNIGGAGESETWYWAGDYNDGYPYLRQFIPWKTLTFSPGAGISVSLESAEVPSDQGLSYNISGATVTFFGGRTSVATETTGCLYFTGWVGPDANNWFFAQSAYRGVGITFKAPTQYKDKDGNLQNLPAGFADVHILQYATDNIETYGNLTLQVDRTDDHGAAYLCGLESIPVVFESGYNRSGIYTSVYFQFNWIRVYFTIPKSSKYYIEGVYINCVNISEETHTANGTTRFHNHGSGAYVQVLLREKTYNPSFQ